SNPMPTSGKAAARTALPQPPRTSQNVPINSAESFVNTAHSFAARRASKPAGTLSGPATRCLDGSRGDHGGSPRRVPLPGAYLRSTDTSVASVQTMSNLSPTFTVSRAVGSCTLDVYFQPFGPVNVTDGVLGSTAVIVAVIVTCLALVPPGRACS